MMNFNPEALLAHGKGDLSPKLPEAAQLMKDILRIPRPERRRRWLRTIRKSKKDSYIPWSETYLVWPHGFEGLKRLNSLALWLESEAAAEQGG
jgi:hypothetical protein